MLGTVTVLRRYPVKSMLGEDLVEAEVSRSGLAGDRRLAVISRRTGKVASAKYPRLWRGKPPPSPPAPAPAAPPAPPPPRDKGVGTPPRVDAELAPGAHPPPPPARP